MAVNFDGKAEAFLIPSWVGLRVRLARLGIYGTVNQQTPQSLDGKPSGWVRQARAHHLVGHSYKTSIACQYRAGRSECTHELAINTCT